VFHLDISGKLVNDEHPQNKYIIVEILLVFHLERSGKEVKDEQPSNI
jgi:hypothetical protein